MFDLEKSILSWRRQMSESGLKSGELLAELEAHLRDDVEMQIRSGVSARAAFEIAVQRMGQPAVLTQEFARAGNPKWELLRKLKAFVLGGREAAFPSLENFTPAARQSLDLAPAQARGFHHDFVGTEHVLLGLAHAQSGRVFNVLQRLGLSRETIRAEVEKIVTPGPVRSRNVNIPFTPRAQRALQLAAAEAKALKQPNVSAEHIFLGLIREGSGVAALALKNLGVQIEKARSELLKEMHANPGAA